MKEKTSIFFIGRRQGIYPFTNTKWYLENARNQEVNGLNSVSKIKIVNSLDKADIIFIRNKPESTSDKQVNKIESKIKNYRENKLIINDVSFFDKVDNKDITFKLWKEDKINCPDYCVLNPNNIEESVEQITNMLLKKESILLRINNRTGGTAMKKIDSHFNKDDVSLILKKLSLDVINYRFTREKTNLIAVEHIKNGNGGYTHAFRAHILNNEIISYYVAISRSLVVSMTKLKPDDLKEFVRVNKKFIELLNDELFKKKILKAMNTITNMGAVDFLLVGDEPIFLEINPMWKGNFFEKNYGNNKILLDWFNNKPELEKDIPNVFKFKYPKTYWGKFYLSLVNNC